MACRVGRISGSGVVRLVFSGGMGSHVSGWGRLLGSGLQFWRCWMSCWVKLGRDSGVEISARGARMPWVGSWVMSSTVWAFSGDSSREDRVRRLVVGVGFFGFFGEDGAGDLQAVEEEAGAAGVDGVGGDALEDFADGLEDGGAIVGIGQREVEGGAAAAALLRVGDGFSGGVVVVAEVFVAEAGAGAAVAVGEDVAALVVLGCGFGFGFGSVAVLLVSFMCSLPHWVKCVQSLQKKRPASGLRPVQADEL